MDFELAVLGPTDSTYLCIFDPIKGMIRIGRDIKLLIRVQFAAKV